MNLQNKNLVIFITDQQRRVMDFPSGWEAENLPGMTRLKKHGLSFERAFTNACMCSPARATMLTGYFPAQHGVKYTLEQSMSASKYAQVPLSLPGQLGNLATVMAATHRNPVYKGKFHVTKYTGSKWVPSDVTQYGFTRWNPQDAGANQSIPEEGGGQIDNDARFLYMDGPVEAGMEGAIAYLKNVAKADQPFCLIISLVNPHDVLFYPKTYINAGYDDNWLPGTIQPPESVNEDLSNKPRIQKQFIQLTALGMGAITTPEMQTNYLNFYGNLMKCTDSHLVTILDLLDSLQMTKDTLIIQTADHGEMGLSHGGARQKCFNFYEQTTNIPLIYSNPELYPNPVTSDALVSHVDFLPTLAALFGAPSSARADWQGIDYSRIVLDPTAPSVQDYLVFTYDDYQCGQPTPSLPPPNHIVSIREERYKLAEYYDANGHVPSEWEMYDLQTDPQEIDNLAGPNSVRTTEQQQAYERLTAKLAQVKQTRLQPLPTTPVAATTAK